MPTYEYQCQSCGHRFEEFQSIMAEPLKKCPACQKKKLQRLLGTGGGIIFKGSGFYSTDYRSDSYQKAAANDKPSSPASSDKPAASGEKASAEKPAAPATGESKAMSPAKSESGKGRSGHRK